MKKTSLICLILLFTGIFSYSSARNPVTSFTSGGPAAITTLVINASVTVVLISYDDAALEMSGRGSFTDLITLTKTGDTLVIGSPKNKDLKEAGIIYVPASQLRSIRINSAANVTSLQALQVPKLNVVVNGACNFSISNIGELNVTGSEAYSVDHSTEWRPVPRKLYARRIK